MGVFIIRCKSWLYTQICMKYESNFMQSAPLVAGWETGRIIPGLRDRGRGIEGEKGVLDVWGCVDLEDNKK